MSDLNYIEQIAFDRGVTEAYMALAGEHSKGLDMNWLVGFVIRPISDLYGDGWQGVRAFEQACHDAYRNGLESVRKKYAKK